MALSKTDINGANIDPEVKKLFLALINAQAGGDSGMASLAVPGTVKEAANQAALVAAPTMADFNTLLTNLKNAGIMVGP